MEHKVDRSFQKALVFFLHKPNLDIHQHWFHVRHTPDKIMQTPQCSFIVTVLQKKPNWPKIKIKEQNKNQNKIKQHIQKKT